MGEKDVASSRGRRQRVQSAEMGMAVLKGLARLGGKATLTALSSHLEVSAAKLHRYLTSLITEELVSQDAASQLYQLGPAAIEVGLAALRQANPVRLGETSLVTLRQELGVTCFIAMMGNKGPTILRFEEPILPVTVNVRAGSVMSLLWSATGRAFLAWADDDTVLDMARHELMDARQHDQLSQLDLSDPIGEIQRQVRHVGCACIVDIYLKGISAVAAPVFGSSHRVAAVLTALGATGGFNAMADGPIAHAIKREAQLISHMLGYREVK